MSRRLLAASIACLLVVPAATAQTRPADAGPASRPAATRPADPDAAAQLADWKRAVERKRSEYVSWLEYDDKRFEAGYWLADLRHAEAVVKMLEAGPADRDRLEDEVVRLRVEYLKLKAELFRRRGSAQLAAKAEAEAAALELEHRVARAGDRATAADRRDLAAARLRFAELELQHAVAEGLDGRAERERAVEGLKAELKAAEERLAADGGAATRPATRP